MRLSSVSMHNSHLKVEELHERKHAHAITSKMKRTHEPKWISTLEVLFFPLLILHFQRCFSVDGINICLRMYAKSCYGFTFTQFIWFAVFFPLFISWFFLAFLRSIATITSEAPVELTMLETFSWASISCLFIMQTIWGVCSKSSSWVIVIFPGDSVSSKFVMGTVLCSITQFYLLLQSHFRFLNFSLSNHQFD